MKKSTSFFIFLLLLSINTFAQIIAPAQWTFEQKKISATEDELIFKATIENGWHLYGID